MKRIFAFGILNFFLFIGYGQTIKYVSSRGVGDGSSWAQSTSLDQALKEASAGSQLWVKAGTYASDSILLIPAKVIVYGGFGGTESQLSQRNYAQNESVLDGKSLHTVVHLASDARLDGFTIQNGFACSIGKSSGGGVYMEAGAKLYYCKIQNNKALFYGGGVYAEGDGLIMNCLVSGNAAARDGVGIYGANLSVRSTTVTDNKIWRCSNGVPAREKLSICEGDSVELHLPLYPTGLYQWSTGAKTNSIIVKPNTNQSYVLIYTNVGSNCASYVEFEVELKTRPNVSVFVQPNMANAGTNCRFTAEGTPVGGTYLWDDVAATNTNVLDAIMPILGNLEHTCIYTLEGCSSQAGDIAINTECTPPVAPSSLQMSASRLCFGESLELEIVGGQRNGGKWYLYFGSCGGEKLDSTTSNRFSVRPKMSGTYYVRGEGCAEQTTCVSAAITVNPLPSPITGASTVCQYGSTQLSSLTSGGTWQGDLMGNVTVDQAGLVTGYAPAEVQVRYILSTGCYTEHKINILEAPSQIEGSDELCGGSTHVYQGFPVGGSYRVLPNTFANIDNHTGSLTVASITSPSEVFQLYYSHLTTACEIKKEVTIFQQPLPIQGSSSVCEGDTLKLNNTTVPSGFWFSSEPSVASFVSQNQGDLITHKAGATKVYYVLGTCADSLKVVVNPRPTLPLISIHLCSGSSTIVNASEVYKGGQWTASPSTIIKVDSLDEKSARLSGISSGKYSLTYTLPTGCRNSLTDSVYSTPAVIVGPSHIGLGQVDTLFSSPIGGSWQSLDNGVVSVQGLGLKGIMQGNSKGVTSISYVLPVSGCRVSHMVECSACASIVPQGGVSQNQSVCMNSTLLPIRFTLNNASKTTIVWTNNLGEIIPSPAGIIFDSISNPISITGSISSSGTYHYEIRTEDQFSGCAPTKVKGKIEVFTALTGGKIGDNQVICEGVRPNAFTNLILANGGAQGGTYQWQRQAFSSSVWEDMPGAGNIDYNEVSLLTESYRYRRLYNNACGKVYSDTVWVKIDSLPVVLSVVVDSNSSCGSGNGKININVKYPINVLYSKDGVGYQTSPVFTDLLTGSYTIYIKNTQSGCSIERTVTLPSSGSGVPLLSIAGKDSICAGDSALWNVHILNTDGSAYTYQWSRSGIADLGRTDALWVKTSASYTVRVTHPQTSCFSVETRSLKVLAPKKITSYMPTSDTTVCVGEFIRFKVEVDATGSPSDFAWIRAEDAAFTQAVDTISLNSESYYMPPAARSRYYKALVSSRLGICSSVETPVLKITALERPSPLITGPSAVCSGDSADLSVPSELGWRYFWMNGTDTLSKTHSARVHPGSMQNTYIVSAHNGYCSASLSHQIDLRLRPSFTYADISSGLVKQTVCHNGTIKEIRGKLDHATSVTIQWKNGRAAKGLIFDPGNRSLSGVVDDVAGIYPYTVYTLGQASECQADSVHGEITILSPVNAGVISGSATVCQGTIPPAFTSMVAGSGGITGGTTYQWQDSIAGGVWTNIAGATEAQGGLAAPIREKSFYRRVYRNLCDTAYSNIIVVDLHELPAVPVISSTDNSSCVSLTNGSLEITSPLGADYEYRIQGDPIWGNSVKFNNLAGGIYRIHIRQKSTSCENMTIATVQNSSASNIPHFSIKTNLLLDTDSICSNASLVTLSSEEHSNCEGATYKWYELPDISNSISTSSSVSVSPNKNTSYRLQITNTGGCAGSQDRMINVINPPVINRQPEGDTVCGSAGQIVFNIGVNASGANVRYQWQRREMGSSVVWENVGSNSNQYEVNNAYNVDTGFYYRCLVGLQHTSVCSIVESVPVHMQLVKIPAPIISGATEVCGGDATTLWVDDIYKSYQWTLNGNPISGATSSLVSVRPSSTGQVYRVEVSNGYCLGGSIVRVNVYENASIRPPTLAETNICINGVMSEREIIVYNATGLTVQWQKDGVHIPGTPEGIHFTKISQGKTTKGGDTCVYNISGMPSLAGLYTYSLTTTGHAIVCPAGTYNGTLKVNTSLDGGEIGAVSNEICYNTSPDPFINVIHGSGGYGVESYQWFRVEGANVDAISGATSPVYNESSDLIADRSYKREYKNSCGIAYSNDLTIRVKSFDPEPTVAIDAQTSCLGPNGRIRVLSPQGNDYEFSINGGSDYQTDSIFSDLNTSTNYQVIARHKASGCRTDAKLVNIPVELSAATPVVSIMAYPKDSVCSNANDVGLKAIVVNAGLNPEYEWNNMLPNADSVTVKPLITTTYTLRVRNMESGCYSTILNMKTIHVLSANSITQQPIGGAVCLDSMLNKTLHVRTNLAGNYQWQASSTGAEGSFKDIVGAVFMDYDVPTNIASDNYYRCMINEPYGICTTVISDAVRFRVLGKPSPTIIPSDTTICNGNSINLRSLATAGSSLLWSSGETTADIMVSPMANPSMENGTTTYSLSESNGVCSANTSSIVRVSRPQTINHVGDAALHKQQICKGLSMLDVPHSVSGGASQNIEPILTWYNPRTGNTAPDGVSKSYSGGVLTLRGTISASADTGLYTWRIYTIGETANVCPADTTTGTILVGDVPSAALIFGMASGSTTACSDTTLTASNGIGGVLYWQGTTSNGISTSNPGNSLLVSASGTYYIRSQSAHGCWGAQASRAVTIQSLPTITTHPSTALKNISSGSFMALSVVAGGSSPLTYQWYSNTSTNNSGGILITGANAASYTPSNAIKGPIYYYCIVSNDCGSISSNISGAHSINCPNPVLTMTSGNRNDSTVRGFGYACKNISKITHTANPITSTPTISWIGPNGITTPPAGIFATWDDISKYANSSATIGDYTWTITAVNMACSSTSSGTIRVKAPTVRPALAGGGAPEWDDNCTANASGTHFTGVGTSTFVNPVIHYIAAANGVQDQWWSAPVASTGCNKEKYSGANASADCRTNCVYEYGDLYSFCAVRAYEKILCPSPWRVPTKDDYANLDKALGGTGNHRSSGSIGGLSVAEQIKKWYIAKWGADYGGLSSAQGDISAQTQCVLYWTRSQTNDSKSKSFYLNDIGVISFGDMDRYVGQTLRCIRDTDPSCDALKLEMTGGKRADTLTQGSCIEMTPITHIQAGTSNPISITWSGPAGGTSEPNGIYFNKNIGIYGMASVSAITGLYTWTLTVSEKILGKTCTKRSSGTIMIKPVIKIPANSEQVINGIRCVSDHQGNTYKSVEIGSQIWLAENMRCTTSPTSITWTQKEQPAASVYAPYYAISTSTTCYGVLYNWAAANDVNSTEIPILIALPEKNRGICPKNWHVPTDAEWCDLEQYLEPGICNKPEAFRGSIASQLAANSQLWESRTVVNAPGNYAHNANQNASGLAVLPAGYRYASGINNESINASLWTATQSHKDKGISRTFYTGTAFVGREGNEKKIGYSVRCIRDVHPDCDGWDLIRTSGDSVQTITRGVGATCKSISPILHELSNNTSTPTLSWQGPNGVTIAPSGLTTAKWDKIDGTPNASAELGEYQWTVRAVKGSCSKMSTGKITVKEAIVRAPFSDVGISTPVWKSGCIANSPGFAGIGMASFVDTSITYIPAANGIAEQWWSAPVASTGCNKTTYTGQRDSANCRANCAYEYGDLYSGCAAIVNQSALCPGAWRLPSAKDLKNLDLALGGNTSDRYISTPPINGLGVSEQVQKWYVDQWGTRFSGSCYPTGGLFSPGIMARYASSERPNVTTVYVLTIGKASAIGPNASVNADFGFSVRCIRDVHPDCDSLELTMIMGSIVDSVIKTGCNIKNINHTGRGGILSISWEGPSGGTSAPLGMSSNGPYGYISGAPNASADAGIYTWTVTATKGSCRKTNTGTIKVKEPTPRDPLSGGGTPVWKNSCTSNASATNFTGVGQAQFVNNTVHHIPAANGIAAQWWSAPVVASGCNKAMFNVKKSEKTADCRTNCLYEYGDLFSWCTVDAYQDILCPSPWRVPSRTDFFNLDKAMGGTGINRYSTSAGYDSVSINKQIKEWYFDRWGASYGGLSLDNGSLEDQGITANYLSLSTLSNTDLNMLYLWLGLRTSTKVMVLCPVANTNRDYMGGSLRCIRDDAP